MIKTLEWNPVLPMVPLLLVAVATLGVLLFFEWQRKQRFRWARLISQFIIVGCVFGLLARPSLPVDKRASPAVILTPGYDPGTLDSLTTAVRGLSVINLSENNRELRSIAGTPIWVVGSGLPDYALSDINYDFEFIPGKLPEGITDIIIPSRVVSGVRDHIRGSYNAGESPAKWIRLVGPGGPEDSTAINRSGKFSFSLSLTPAVAGMLMYRVEELDSTGDVLQSSRLPLYAEKQRKMEILIISDHPTFELRYLKNFLADKGHSIGMRNRVSRNRFHEEFANRSRYALSSLSAKVLDQIDVLIIDQASFAAMSGTERSAIVQSLRSGLGLVFLPASATPATHPLIALSTLKNAQDTVRITLPGMRATLPSLAVTPAGDVTPVITGENERIVSGCRCTGELRVGFQLLRETYQLGLQGKVNSYSAIWTPLLEKVARELRSDFRISIENIFPVFTDLPQVVNIASSGPTPKLFYDSLRLPLIEDVNIDGWWHGRFWADGNRWHQLRADSSTVHFFDLPSTEWSSMRVSRQMKANEYHKPQSQVHALSTHRRSWDLMFFVLFVIASGFLWLAPKL